MVELSAGVPGSRELHPVGFALLEALEASAHSAVSQDLQMSWMCPMDLTCRVRFGRLGI